MNKIIDTELKTIVLVGQPNSGKSTLFSVMSDVETETSNYAGTTDKILGSDVNINGQTYTVFDLPGTYSLNPTTKSEEDALDYLIKEKADLIVHVVDASLLSRSLELAVELTELGLPMVVAMNMMDEAESHGIDVDVEKLSKILNVPVVPTVAIHGKGVRTLAATCQQVLNQGGNKPATLDFTHHVEEDIENLSGVIESHTIRSKVDSRFWAIKAIENPELLPKDVAEKTGELRKAIAGKSEKMHKVDGFETVSYERHHLAMKISEEITSFRESRSRPMLDRFDDLLLHPVFGYMFLGLFFLMYFFLIFVIGDFLASLIEGPIDAVADTFAPLKQSSPFLWHTINGAYLGFSGVLGLILPYFLPLVFLTSIFEETGYMARIAFLVDGMMHKIGLHGKSVVPFILGFGCSVPAIYATRMIENKTDRIITGMLIPFIPCSARIAVIFALTAAFTGPFWALVVFLWVLLIIAIAGKAMTRFLRKPMGLILEIPVLKAPNMRLSSRKTWLKISDFVKEALIFLVAGSIVLGWIEFFHAAQYVNDIFEPVLTGILGLPDKLGSTLVFGFFRKELILVMVTQAMDVRLISQLPLTPDQIIVFIIFVTLYFPCFTTFVVIWKEFGAKVIALSSVLSILVALVSAFLFKIILAF